MKKQFEVLAWLKGEAQKNGDGEAFQYQAAFNLLVTHYLQFEEAQWKAEAELASARQQIEALRKDAERYRFIRDADRSDCITPELSLYAMKSLDEYVDAAMEDEQRLKDAAIDAALPPETT